MTDKLALETILLFIVLPAAVGFAINAVIDCVYHLLMARAERANEAMGNIDPVCRF